MKTINDVILSLEGSVEKLRNFRDKKNAEIEAGTHALNALWDGLKYTNTAETALTFTSPQIVKQNIFYTDGKKTFVCIKNGTATTEAFDEYFVNWSE